MSLRLKRGTKPEGLTVKTHGIGEQIVFLGNHEISCEISMEDFLLAAYYVLTNTDLKKGVKDPRLQFVESVTAMKVVNGYNEGRLRLETEIWPIRD